MENCLEIMEAQLKYCAYEQDEQSKCNHIYKMCSAGKHIEV